MELASAEIPHVKSAFSPISFLLSFSSHLTNSVYEFRSITVLTML